MDEDPQTYDRALKGTLHASPALRRMKTLLEEHSSAGAMLSPVLAR